MTISEIRGVEIASEDVAAGVPAARAGLGNAFELDQDTWALNYWLQTAASKSPNTQRSYRKEATRWRAFLMSLHQSTSNNRLMIDASYEDVAKFIQWIQMEDAAALEVPPKVAARLQMSPIQCVKPKASQVVLRQAVVILHGMYEELMEAVVEANGDRTKVCSSNPFKPYRRQFSKPAQGVRLEQGPDPSGVAKALSPVAWEKAWEYASAEVASDSSATAKAQAARRRLVMAMLRATWERRNAVSRILWKDIAQSRDRIWHIKRNRKGKGDLWAPIPEQLVDEIIRFRVSTGRPPTIQESESQRSIFWLGGAGSGKAGPVSDSMIYRTVKEVFDGAAKLCESQGDTSTATELQRAGAGPHTIRHTMATTYLANGGELRIAQAILGHSSPAITSQVYDTRSNQEQAREMRASWDLSNPKKEI